MAKMSPTILVTAILGAIMLGAVLVVASSQLNNLVGGIGSVSLAGLKLRGFKK